jgi:hypothetical protein
VKLIYSISFQIINLPDVVVFTQAGSNDINYLLKIKNQALENSRSQNFTNQHYDDKHAGKE